MMKVTVRVRPRRSKKAWFKSGKIFVKLRWMVEMIKKKKSSVGKDDYKS